MTGIARKWREAAGIVWRLLTSGDVDRFEREARAFRARHGISGPS